MLTGRHPRLNKIAIVVIVVATLLVVAPLNASDRFVAAFIHLMERLP